MDGATGNKLKIALVVVLLAGALGISLYNFRDNSPLAGDVAFVCVQTGERYSFDREDISEMPMQNPDTGEKTLLPIVEDGDAAYVSRDYAYLLKELAEVNEYVDPATRKVKDKP